MRCRGADRRVSEFRIDPIFGDLSVVAQERASRPHRQSMRDTLEASGPCPLCAGQEGMNPPEVARVGKTEGAWQARAFSNRYPALSLEAKPEFQDPSRAPALLTGAPGFGIHEVVVDSPSHSFPFWALSPEDASATLELLQSRLRDLSRDQRIRYTQIFKNHRAGSGGSLEHPHFQIVGLPFVPPKIQRVAQSEHCLVCEVLKAERGLADQDERSHRLLTESSRFVALADFAPTYQYQFSIYPKSHAAGFEEITREEREELAQVCSWVIGRLEGILGEFPMNLIFYTQPNPTESERCLHGGSGRPFHWFIRVTPRIGQLGGFEVATGIALIQVSPEDAARAFRERGA